MLAANIWVYHFSKTLKQFHSQFHSFFLFFFAPALFILFFPPYLLLGAGFEFVYYSHNLIAFIRSKNSIGVPITCEKASGNVGALFLLHACVMSIVKHAVSNWILCQGTIQLRGAVCSGGRVADNSLNRSWGRVVTQVEDWSQCWGLSQSYIVSLQWAGGWPEPKFSTLTSNWHIKSKLSADCFYTGNEGV